MRHFGAFVAACAAVIVKRLAALFGADHVTTWVEDRFYGESIIGRESSADPRVVVTVGGAGVRRFLDGNLQFRSRDEFRYHPSLVHPALAAHGAPRRVLVLGGDDGLAVREVLKHPGVQQVALVELDPHTTRLFAQQPVLVGLNAGALKPPCVKIVNANAHAWIEDLRPHAPGAADAADAAGVAESRGTFDVILIDFPDPTNFSRGKLHTTRLYTRADQALSAGGYLAVQTTSPLIARESFWTVFSTPEAVGLSTTPHHVHVPSFSEWGFVIAGRRPWRMPTALPEGLRLLTLPGCRAAGAAAFSARHGACAGPGQPAVEPGAPDHVRRRRGLRRAMSAGTPCRRLLAGCGLGGFGDLIAAGCTPSSSTTTSRVGGHRRAARPPPSRWRHLARAGRAPALPCSRPITRCRWPSAPRCSPTTRHLVAPVCCRRWH